MMGMSQPSGITKIARPMPTRRITARFCPNGVAKVARPNSRVAGLTPTPIRPRRSGARRAGVDHAEAVALGVGEDDVVRVRRHLVPMNLGRADADEPGDL